jgi:hypothetical protein
MDDGAVHRFGRDDEGCGGVGVVKDKQQQPLASVEVAEFWVGWDREGRAAATAKQATAKAKCGGLSAA